MSLHRCSLMITAASLFLAATMSALASPLDHTWVSSTGSDTTGSGTIESPYATFRQAYYNTAPGGVISVLTPGDFGSLNIYNAITIDGGGRATICSSGEGINVAAGPTDSVTLQGFSMVASTARDPAIWYHSGAQLLVKDCFINGFNMGLGTRNAGARTLLVQNTTINGCPQGVYIEPGSGPIHAFLENVQIAGASEVAIYARSGRLEISHSRVTSSTIALKAETNAIINAEGNYIAFNGTAFDIAWSSTLRLSNNDIFDNTVGFATRGGTIASAKNNKRGGQGGGASPTMIPVSVF
jgi:hypothetical protein